MTKIDAFSVRQLRLKDEVSLPHVHYYTLVGKKSAGCMNLHNFRSVSMEGLDEQQFCRRVLPRFPCKAA